MALSKSQINPPVPRQEEVEVPEIGPGSVIIRSLPLRERQRIQASGGTNIEIGLETLSLCVVDQDNEPIWTVDEWDVFAGGYSKRFNELLEKSYKLSDLLGEEAKKRRNPELSFTLLLCRSLGCTLEELYARMSSEEYSVWRDEYSRNPWGEHRDSLNAAVVAQAVANYAGKTIKDGQSAKLHDFILKFEPQETVEDEIDPATFFKQFEG